MSKNALALVDCNNREQLFQFLIDTFDRKAVKNEMVSPYDDQLIGKMNFHYNNMDHAMFFTYARSSEYPGMRFRNHKIIYLSLGVNDTSTAVFNQICAHFGGFVDYNDDLDNGWQKIERQKQLSEESLEPITDVVSVQDEPQAEDSQKEIRQILKLERKNEGQREHSHRSQNSGKKENRNGRYRNHERSNPKIPKTEIEPKTEKMIEAQKG